MKDDMIIDDDEENFIVAASVDSSGETVPVTLDDRYFNMLSEIDADTFETKFFPVEEKKPKSKFIVGKSKFISNSVDEEDIEKIALMEKKKWKKNTLRGKDLVDLQTTDVVKVDKKTKSKFIRSLADNISNIKKYLVDEIAPSQLALLNAFDQSNQTLESILGVKVDQSTKVIESMMMDAYRLKVFYYLADVLKLTEEQRKIITDKYFVITVPTTSKNVNLSS